MEEPIEIIDKVDISFNQLTNHKIINNIEVIKKLGSGQYAKVILGKDLTNKKFVAIKEISRQSRNKVLKRLNHKNINTNKQDNFNTPNNDNDQYNDQEYIFPKRILQEVNVMSKCQNLNPNIIKLHSVFNDVRYKSIYLILEYCYNGEIKWQNSFNKSQNTCKTLHDVIRLIKDVIIGLEFLKLNNVIHRDIKPPNLLIDHKGNIKISDFGVSYIVDDQISIEDQQKELNKTVGTPLFLAPELCNLRKFKDNGSLNSSTDSVNDSIVYNNSLIDHSEFADNASDNEEIILDYKLDIWSFGVTIYCILFNDVPFKADYEYELFTKITNEEVKYPSFSGLLQYTPDETASMDAQQIDEMKSNDLRLFKHLNTFLKRILVKNPNKRCTIDDLKHDEIFDEYFGNDIAGKNDFMTFNSNLLQSRKQVTQTGLSAIPISTSSVSSNIPSSSSSGSFSAGSVNVTPTTADSKTDGLKNSRFNSLKTIYSSASKNSATLSSITSKTLSMNSIGNTTGNTSGNTTANNTGNTSTSRSISRDNSSIINSTSNNSISQVSNKTSSSKKSFNKLRKTFSKLKLRNTSGNHEDMISSGSINNTSSRIPSIPANLNSGKIPNSDSKQSISSISSTGEYSNKENIEDLYEKPSFSKLLRKKSSQFLLGKPKSPFKKSNNKSMEELNSPIKFKYKNKNPGTPNREGYSSSTSASPLNNFTSVENADHDIVDAQASIAKVGNSPTVKLVNNNDRLMTPEEYRNDNTDHDSSFASEEVADSKDLFKTSYRENPDSSNYIVTQDKESISGFSLGSFDTESRNGASIASGNDQFQNFFNKLMQRNDNFSNESYAEENGHEHSNSHADTFEDYTSEEEDVTNPKNSHIFKDSTFDNSREESIDYETRKEGFYKFKQSVPKDYLTNSNLLDDDDEDDDDLDFGENFEEDFDSEPMPYDVPYEEDISDANFGDILKIKKQISNDLKLSDSNERSDEVQKFKSIDNYLEDYDKYRDTHRR